MSEKKIYKISETEAERVLVKNVNDRPNALASYGIAKKTPTDTKDIFDKQFRLVQEKHNLLADEMDAREEANAIKLKQVQDTANKAVADVEGAVEASSAAVKVAGNAAAEASLAKDESAEAKAKADEAKTKSEDAVDTAISAKEIADQLREEADSGAFKGEKGDKGDPFRVTAVYASVAEMNADFDNPDIPVGAFVVIDTGNVDDEENARLYIKGKTSYTFITDLSGAEGMRGPQGPEGKQGPRGEPGQKGDSYVLTDVDRNEIYNRVMAGLPTWEGGSF